MRRWAGHHAFSWPSPVYKQKWAGSSYHFTLKWPFRVSADKIFRDWWTLLLPGMYIPQITEKLTSSKGWCNILNTCCRWRIDFVQVVKVSGRFKSLNWQYRPEWRWIMRHPGPGMWELWDAEFSLLDISDVVHCLLLCKAVVLESEIVFMFVALILNTMANYLGCHDSWFLVYKVKHWILFISTSILSELSKCSKFIMFWQNFPRSGWKQWRSPK